MLKQNIARIIKLSSFFFKLATQSHLSLDLEPYKKYQLRKINEYNQQIQNKAAPNADQLSEKAEVLIGKLQENKVGDEALYTSIRERDVKNIHSFLSNYRSNPLDSYYADADLRMYMFECFQAESPDQEISQEKIDLTLQKDLQILEAKAQEHLDFLSECISRIKKYHGTQWKVVPYMSYDDSVDEYYVNVEVIPSKYPALYFTIDKKNNVFKVSDELEDIESSVADISKGKDSKFTADYMNLISEIKEPGSSSSSKIVTLYTARPVKDRSLYRNSDSIPNNVYLTTSIDSAEGLSIDLPGPRDIYQVEIEEHYLLETGSFQKEKWYRVKAEDNSPTAPVKSLINLTDV